MIPPRPGWQDKAICKGRTDLFYGPPGEQPGPRAQRIRLARQLCNQCPVIEPCRTHAATYPERHGVWAGQDETERGWPTTRG